MRTMSTSLRSSRRGSPTDVLVVIGIGWGWCCFCWCCVCAQPSALVWCSAPCTSLELLAEFVSVEFDWSGSGWNRSQAIANGVFIPSNNVIAGVNFYGNRTFLTVPRWRPGVPSTLNTLVYDPLGRPLLQPFPNWEWQRRCLHYVQSVFVDQENGHMWIIDTGRENFFASNPSQTINRAASLLVIDIQTFEVHYNITFPNSILPFDSSFLNDIRVNTNTKQAFMTDTNINPERGALIVVDVITGFQRRYEGATTYAQPGFQVNVGGVAYPMNSPVDGIALSPDFSMLYYSAVNGSRIYRVPTSILFDPSASDQAISQSTMLLFDKGTASDGLAVAPVGQGQIGLFYGKFTVDAFAMVRLDATGSTILESSAVELSRGSQWFEWVDTIVAEALSPTSTVVYFTTNRLPQYVFQTMDFHGLNGPNMRVFRMQLNSIQQVSPSSSCSSTRDWAISVTVLFALTTIGLISVGWLYCSRNSISRSTKDPHLHQSFL